ncbi:CAAX protease, partial [Oscillatoriales cyanobacterium LEGE 11467]
VLGLLALTIGTGSIAILLATLGKLVTLAFIIIVATAVLSPLEALGWWAGWFGDRIDTARNPGTVLETVPPSSHVTRYVLYLDGIGQSSYNYDFLVKRFLAKLAAILPDDIVLISGFMPYSILNIPLTRNRISSSFWRWVEREQKTHPGTKLSFAVYLKNMFVVAISADRRYGPIYNQGIAQLIYNSLVKYGYQLGSGIPITLVGYSGGGQISMGALPFLKQALGASVEVISLAGVLSGNTKAISLEHLYHLAGENDSIEQLGSTIFPKRTPLFFLSYWNRAKRRGQISTISLGPVGHNGPEGVLDADYYLPDGRSSLQQTLDWISGIITGQLRVEIAAVRAKSSNYERFRQADFNQLQYYPLDRTVDPELYRPIAPWMGRLILPESERRQTVRGVLFEVHHADKLHQHSIGQVVHLRWSDSAEMKKYVRSLTRDVYFSDNAEYSSRVEGLIHPTRLDRWRQVDPLESLAGARPEDDMLVMLREPISVGEAREPGGATVIEIDCEPVQISGRYYGLVRILQPVGDGGDRFEVVHFNRQSHQFDGPKEIVRLPQVVADSNDTLPATNQGIEKSPLNPMGWYIYGAPDSSGLFVVQAIAPRALLGLQPESVIGDREAALEFIKKETWDNLPAKKGKIQSVLLCPQSQTKAEAVQKWQEGDRALLLHVYGGIGGRKIEPAAIAPVYFGHFAYGDAQVIRDPLSDELRFEIEYHQVYTHNARGLISGHMHWSAYMGDRQWGFLGTRPICDLLVKLDAFTADFDFERYRASALSEIVSQLEAMMARYRIGDGTGGTYVGPANNCSQDSNQAMYAALRKIENRVQRNRTWLEKWRDREPEQAQRFQQLLEIKNALKSELMPFGSARADWEEGTYNLGSVLEDRPLKNLSIGLASWRTLLPRLASDTIVKIFLDRGATVWVLRTNQVGGYDPDIEPLAPMTL